ncbi:hypothetical protein GCM10008018_05080 [Paenibacillus marchantiophytorum]|uniref:Uncharacterized protein n=1 Tax=Paenibacillus marchantiophytorum TaxID=1619310 RepID=A0ABQ2BNR3_9BACL|nr:hypothetical protein [Paenibacillus marchantiophytorum]GGI44033.1 hypothetical protein GCM10008018_05080 [Paenibacillus marchantiophytorum]
MKKSLITLSIISTLSLTILGGAVVLAQDPLQGNAADEITSVSPKPNAANDGLNCDKNQDGHPANQPRLKAGERPKGEKPAPRGGAGAVTPSAPPSDSNSEQAANTVVISGGFQTDPQDKGRPVVLIAAALGVPTEVFREAFSGVTPAGLDRGPTSEEAQKNKAALLKVLAPYGITNERLDEVSNYYRYNGRGGGLWSHTQATAALTVTDGVVTGITITNPGSGYSSNPVISVMGPNGKVTATAEVVYTKDFKTNGSISSIKLN